MRLILLVFLTALAGCATVSYQPYEGKTNVYEGNGGTKVSVDGIDFWANGTPPRKFSILGYVVSEIGSGYGDEALIRSAVAAEVKKQGGSAVIQVENNASFAGAFLLMAPNMYMGGGVRRMRFAVVKYVQ